MAGDTFPTSLRQISLMVDWEEYFGAALRDGVAGVPGGTTLAATLNTSTRQLVLAPGGFYGKTRYRQPQAASEALAIPAASSQDRVDRCFMRLDRTALTNADFLKPVIVAGTPGSTPQPPAPTRTTTGLYDFYLWSYRARSNGAVDNLTDERRYNAPAGSAIPAKADAMPAQQTGLMVYQTDTGILLVGGGSAFRPVFEDTDYVNVALAGGNWKASSQPPTTVRVRAVNGLTHLEGRVERTVNALAAGQTPDPGVEFLVLPQAFWPAQNHYFETSIGDNGGNWGKFYVDAGNGHVRLLWCLDPIPVGTQVGLGTSWLRV